MSTNEPNPSLTPATVELRAVSTAEEIRENIRRFNRDLRAHQDRATTIARQTSYWVFDERDGTFGPSKFVGYRSMNFSQYEAALSGESSGARFDGAFTRAAIESVVGTYGEEETLISCLREWCESGLGQGVLDGIDAAKWRFVRVTDERSYWAFVCRPDRFAGLEAVATLSEMEWTVDRGEPKPGDRLLLWQAKAGGDRRGVIALGEVIEGRRLAGCPVVEAGFWRDAIPELTERIRLRVFPLPGLPIWEDDAPELLNQLAVARARGGTVFSLEPEQWHELRKRAGGSIGNTTTTSTRATGGQGFLISPAARKAVELHAQSMAEDHFISLGFEVTDVSQQCSYDLHCVRQDEELRVEVKGTTGAGVTVFLTRNEVAHAREHASHMALVIVRNIQLHVHDEVPITNGGEMQVLHPWNIDEGSLSPMQFEYSPNFPDSQNKLS